MLLLDGEDLDDASRVLANWRQQRQTLEEQMQAEDSKRNVSPEREAARVAAELVHLRETFALADPATLRAALATVIEDITLYWTDGGPRKYRFQRGTIRLGDSLHLLASCTRKTMTWVLEFTEADWSRPPSEPEKMAEAVRKMFDEETPVWTKYVAAKLQHNFGIEKTHLHRADRMGLLECVPRKRWLPVASK